MKRILCVIDFQNDFISGSLGSPAAESARPAVAARIREYLDRGDEVVFTRDMHTAEEYASSCEGRHIGTPHCMSGTEGCGLDDSVADLAEGCLVFDKSTFASMDLADHLRRGGYDSVEFAGLVTNICVICNAVLARTVLPDASIVVDRSCVATYDEHLGKAALDVLASICVDIV